MTSMNFSINRRPRNDDNGPAHDDLAYSSVVHQKRNGTRTCRLQSLLPNSIRRYQFSISRFGRKRGRLLLCSAGFLMILVFFALAEPFGIHPAGGLFGDPSTLVFKREDLQRIWKWEIASGHYPSRRAIPRQLRLESAPNNPALPPRRHTTPSRFIPSGFITTTTHGIGPKRVYLDIQSQPPNIEYPSRPIPGSIADLDLIIEHCDISARQYVRDCLEVLRVGAGLDSGKQLRQGEMNDWKYIYLEQAGTEHSPYPLHARDISRDLDFRGMLPEQETDPNCGLTRKRGADWETPPIVLPPPLEYHSYATLPTPCDPEHPRLFHMVWTGPFTDKPYLLLLSFLYTQNIGLHRQHYPEGSGACPPQLWVWINPGPTFTAANPSATREMFDQLRSNPWASPFLHPRFKDVIQFKLWNTTEQLDGVPELKDEWRTKSTLFNSLGRAIRVPHRKYVTSEASNVASKNGWLPAKVASSRNKIRNRPGSKSRSSYDKLSVILSDMARFILCHRFGGIYLDADTIFLRDWEELWGWKGAFTYRWSRMERYNTAVLHMNKGSALGTFLFRTALKNDLDFHPATVTRYFRDAHLEGLLLRLPGALFDAAWLNVEGHELDRPPQPLFTSFQDFFYTPHEKSTTPQAFGFDGFFKGAYSYHFHNHWWIPFDPAWNWPNLGPRFAAEGYTSHGDAIVAEPANADPGEDKVGLDQRDLDWATVLKRTCEAYIRGEQPNMYGEWIQW